jgi:hypothetical protein
MEEKSAPSQRDLTTMAETEAEQTQIDATEEVEKKQEGDEDKKARRAARRSNKRSLHTYITRTVHKRSNNGKQLGANRSAARVLENATAAFMDAFIANQCELARLSGHSTVDEHVVFATVKLMVPREIAPVFIEAAKTAADTFIQSAKTPEQESA